MRTMTDGDQLMKTVFILDPHWGGHHPTYFKILTQTLINLECRVFAICPDPEDVMEWIELNCPGKVDLLNIFPIEKLNLNRFEVLKFFYFRRLYSAISAFFYWRQASFVVRSLNEQFGVIPDLVFFPWLDSYLGYYLISPLIDLIFPYNWSGLYFQPSHLRKRKKLNFLPLNPFPPHLALLSRNCHAINLLDEGVIEKIEAVTKDKPIFIFPDFTDESPPNNDFPLIEKIKSQAQQRKIVGLFGSLDKRKGLLKFLEVAQSSEVENLFFVCIGQLHRESFTLKELSSIDRFCELKSNNCFICFERVPDEPKFNALINMCDILYAVYDYPHSSNILTKAAIFQKPVISSNEFCMGERVEMFQLGVTTEKDDTEQCIEGLKCLALGKSFDGRQIQPNFEGYKKNHSNDLLYEHFAALLSSELGLD